MAATNNDAKEAFITRIINLNPSNYVGSQDKKYYFWENGVQIAVSLTCPKVPIGEPKADEAESAIIEPISYTPEITQDEKDTLAKLMDALGI